MANALDNTEWICLMDYATRYGVSLSTLRRHIKASKVQYRVENGRYLIASHHSLALAAPTAPAAPAARGPSDPTEMSELKLRLRHAQEEIAELKMLVALYEDQQHGL